jgi:hypothetical protein
MAGNDWNRERSDLNKADICLSLGNDRMDCGAQLPSRRHREQGIYPAQRAGVKNTLGLHDRITVKQAGRQARKYSLLHRSAQRTFLQRKLSRPMPVPEQPAPPQRYFRSAETIGHQLQIASCTQGSALFIVSPVPYARGGVSRTFTLI